MPRAKPQRTKYPGVFKRVTNGGTVYDIAYRIPGEQNPRWIRGEHRSLDEAHRVRIEILYGIQHGAAPNSRQQTLRDFVEHVWLVRAAARVTEGLHRESTRAQYVRDVKNHVVPALGARRLDTIATQDVEALKDSLLASGLSPDTVRRVQTTLGYVLKEARKHALMSHNPVTDAEKPAPRRRRPDLPTVEQVWQVADASRSLATRSLILFAAFTGIRISELFGLRWASVDLARGDERVRIVEQFYKGEHVDHAKSAAGNRELVLGEDAADVLHVHHAAQLVDETPNHFGLVFPAPEGGYWRDSNFNRRVWQPARNAASLPDLKFHTLRFFYVSQVRAQGLAAPITEQLVGHTDERTHVGYTRPIPGTEDQIREAQSGLFARPEAE